jgi:hypothetical protein
VLFLLFVAFNSIMFDISSNGCVAISGIAVLENARVLDDMNVRGHPISPPTSNISVPFDTTPYIPPYRRFHS